MTKLDINKYRDEIDNDKQLTAQRRALVTVSLLLLALCLSGAAIKEANTFIFRIEFTNHEGLTYLLAAAVVFFLVRYYAYAQIYHSQLFDFWSERLLDDYRVFNYDTQHEEVGGLLGKRINFTGHDEPGLRTPRYKKVGILKRNLVYTSEGHDEHHGHFSYDENIELNKYSNDWTKKDFHKLLRFEFKYRIEAILKHREYLDIMFPYLLGIAAIISLTAK